MTTPFLIRIATLADAPTIARHRADMFRDIGTLPDALYSSMIDATRRYLETAMPTGEYVGWLAAPATEPERVIAGIGVQLRAVLPHMGPDAHALAFGPDGFVVNVFTERSWRRRGVAKQLMRQLLEWAPRHGVNRLALHASREGRLLYDQLGFVSTNEMRWTSGS
ncbi:MAG TPA: GNAT family N-acetyltransferase [Gemmatimonadaceae bacterium]|nr:GNAT family N-acetyltransferase [Gemmatimonadaceae bacterium]